MLIQGRSHLRLVSWDRNSSYERRNEIGTSSQTHSPSNIILKSVRVAPYIFVTWQLSYYTTQYAKETLAGTTKFPFSTVAALYQRTSLPLPYSRRRSILKSATFPVPPSEYWDAVCRKTDCPHGRGWKKRSTNPPGCASFFFSPSRRDRNRKL